MLLGKPSASLAVNLLQTKFFVNPTADGPQSDPLVHGTITITLKKATVVQELSVGIEGICDITCPGSSDHAAVNVFGHKTLERYLSLSPGDEPLPAGQTGFAFTLAVPSSTAPSQRCQYGRIVHKIVAKVTIGGKEVTAMQRIQITSCPGDKDGVPALNMQATTFVEPLGPFNAEFTSSYLTIGAPMLTHISLPSLPSAVDLMRVTVSVVQHFEITAADRTVAPPAQPWRVFVVDHQHPESLDMPAFTPPTTTVKKPFIGHEVPLARCEEGGAFSLNHLARLPCDNYLRPSTSPNSVTPFKLHHEIELDIAFRVQGQEIQHLLVKKPLFVSNCCVMLADLTLPQYSADPVPVTGPLRECICGSTIKDLLDENGASIIGAYANETCPVPVDFDWKTNTLGEGQWFGRGTTTVEGGQ